MAIRAVAFRVVWPKQAMVEVVRLMSSNVDGSAIINDEVWPEVFYLVD